MRAEDLLYNPETGVINIIKMRRDLANIMGQRGMTVKIFCEAADICYITFSAFVNGKRRLSTPTLFKIIRAIEEFKDAKAEEERCSHLECAIQEVAI